MITDTHLPDMFMRELLVAEFAVVEIPAEMNVPVHPDVVAGSVVFPTLHTDVSLLTPGSNWSQHVAFLELGAVRRRVDAVQGQDVVAVGVGDVFATILSLNNSRENKKLLLTSFSLISIYKPF